MRPEDRPLSSSGFNLNGDLPDQLDALLTARRAGRPASARTATAELAPLLEAAETLTPLASAQPSAEFAAQLETQLMARVESRGIPQTMTALPPALPTRRAPSPPRRRLSQLTWAAVAACVLLGMTVGALTASAHPGAPFYSLRKAVEGLSSDLTGASAAAARENLQRATVALASFNAAASRGDNAAALTALGQLTSADHQAAEAITQVGDSGQRATFQSQLDTLHAQEKLDLHVALPNLNWSARAKVTDALRTLHATTLVVTSARIAGGTGGGTSKGGNGGKPSGPVTVNVTGAGFTPGAVLLINGQQMGVVDAVTPGTLVAHVDAGALSIEVESVGVGEPDGSAASTTHLESDGRDTGSETSSTPEPGDTATPGGDATPGNGSSDGGDSTPNPQETPGVTPSPTSSNS